MRVQRIGSRGTILTFDDNISLFLITGTRLSILCDTHLGPLSMEEIQEWINIHAHTNRLVIFNSHSDWDHIWGNCAFPDIHIIGHETCRSRMMERGAFDLTTNRMEVRGNVRIVLPDCTFSDRFTLEDEEVEFAYAPGHTIDSSVCHDRRDGILYLGDLVEDPIPYLDYSDLDTYLDTLGRILAHPAAILVSAHSGVVTRELVRKNMAYITAIRDGTHKEDTVFGEYERVHRWNINQRIFLRFYPLAHEILGDRYSSVVLLEEAGDLHECSPEELEQNLRGFLTRVSE